MYKLIVFSADGPDPSQFVPKVWYKWISASPIWNKGRYRGTCHRFLFQSLWSNTDPQGKHCSGSKGSIDKDVLRDSMVRMGYVG